MHYVWKPHWTYSLAAPLPVTVGGLLGWRISGTHRLGVITGEVRRWAQLQHIESNDGSPSGHPAGLCNYFGLSFTLAVAMGTIDVEGGWQGDDGGDKWEIRLLMCPYMFAFT